MLFAQFTAVVTAKFALQLAQRLRALYFDGAFVLPAPPGPIATAGRFLLTTSGRRGRATKARLLARNCRERGSDWICPRYFDQPFKLSRRTCFFGFGNSTRRVV